MVDLVEMAPEYRELLAAHGLDTLEGACAWTRGRRLDKEGLESWRQRWRIELTAADGRTHTLYLKRFISPPLLRQWQRWREAGPWHSTAHVEWHRGRQLAAQGIPAVRAVAMAERMCAGREIASVVLLEEVQGESLEVIAARRPELRPVASPAAIESLARLVARFHAGGFVHRDLYLSHIFLRQGRPGTDPDDYVLIDLQRVFQPRWRRRRWVIKDLAALAFSTPQDWVGPRARLRFLARYVRGVMSSARRTSRRHELRRLERLVRRRTQRLAAKAARRRPASLAGRVVHADDPAASIS